MVHQDFNESGAGADLQRLRTQATKIEDQLMKDNIYKRRVFEKLVAYEKAIDDIACATHTDVVTLVRESGIQDPLALLNRSISHWDKMLASSEILPEVELID